METAEGTVVVDRQAGRATILVAHPPDRASKGRGFCAGEALATDGRLIHGFSNRRSTGKIP
jgi:hypothetical protein